MFPAASNSFEGSKILIWYTSLKKRRGKTLLTKSSHQTTDHKKTFQVRQYCYSESLGLLVSLRKKKQLAGFEIKKTQERFCCSCLHERSSVLRNPTWPTRPTHAKNRTSSQKATLWIPSSANAPWSFGQVCSCSRLVSKGTSSQSQHWRKKACKYIKKSHTLTHTKHTHSKHTLSTHTLSTHTLSTHTKHTHTKHTYTHTLSTLSTLSTHTH